jgi:hypothetical protein
MKSYELFQVYHSYYPLVLSVNYQKNGKLYAFINYAHFTKDSQGNINGAHITKQVILVNGIPFEIKSIYGLNLAGGAKEVEGEAVPADGMIDDGEGSECLVCLSEPKNTIIMPCGHLCVCSDCGKALHSKAYTCPICRGNIGSLIPFNMKTNKKV